MADKYITYCEKFIAESKTEPKAKVPTSTLDHLLVPKGSSLTPKYLSFLDGSEVTKKNLHTFVDQVVKMIQKKSYLTIDHLVTKVLVDDITFLYLSLDNSVRANKEGFSLYKRLDAICNLIKVCLTEKTVIFFSEACRSSFDGGDINNKVNEHSWFQLRRQISSTLGLTFLGECTNNEDTNGMSFGIAAFSTDAAMPLIHSVLPKRILKEGNGSGAVGTKLMDGSIVWGVHFPLDFKGQHFDNLGAKAMRGLIEIMQNTKGSVCAMGDFNSLPGKISWAIIDAIGDGFELRNNGHETFFGAFYDTVVPKEGEIWIPLFESS